MPCARLPIEWQPSLAKLRWPPSLQIIVTRMWPLCCVVLCCVVTTVFWPECDHCVAIHRTTIWPSSLSSCQCHTKNFAWENICLWFCPLPLPFALALCPDLFALIFALALAFLLHLFLLLHFDLFRFWQQNVRGGSSLTLVYWSSPPQPQNAPHQQGGAAPALQHLQLYLGRLEVSHPDHHLPWGQIECPGAPPLHLRNAFATQHGAPSASRASHLKPGQQLFQIFLYDFTFFVIDVHQIMTTSLFIQLLHRFPNSSWHCVIFDLNLVVIVTFINKLIQKG